MKKGILGTSIVVGLYSGFLFTISKMYKSYLEREEEKADEFRAKMLASNSTEIFDE